MKPRNRAFVTLAATVAVGGWLFAQSSSPNPSETIRQLQATLVRLQAEIRSLQATVERLVEEAKTSESVRANGSQQLTAPTIPVTATPLRRAREAYLQGERQKDQQLCGPAIQSFSEAIHLDPRHDAAFLHRGLCYSSLGDYESAIADFNRSLAVQPDNSRAYYARAVANAAVGKNVLALADINEALRRDPKYSESYLLQGALYREQGESQRALAAFSTVLSLSPNSEKALLGRAMTFLRDGLPESALPDCENAVRVNPNSFAAFLCQGEAFVQLGLPNRAVEAVDRAAQAAQMLDQPLFFLNDTWQSMQAKNVDPSPKLPLAASDAAPAPLQASNVQPATHVPPQSIVSPAPKAAPAMGITNDTAHYLKLGREAFSRESFGEALKFLSQAIQLDPNHANAYNARGYANLRLKNLTNAVLDFTQAIQLNGLYANAYHNRAVARRLLGDRAGAAEDDRAAASLLAAASRFANPPTSRDQPKVSASR